MYIVDLDMTSITMVCRLESLGNTRKIPRSKVQEQHIYVDLKD